MALLNGGQALFIWEGVGVTSVTSAGARALAISLRQCHYWQNPWRFGKIKTNLSPALRNCVCFAKMSSSEHGFAETFRKAGARPKGGFPR